MAAVVACGTALAAGWHRLSGQVLGRPYPYNTFLFDPSLRFGDLFESIRTAKAYGTPGATMITYTPFSQLVFRALGLAPEGAALVLIVAVFAAALLPLLWRAVRPSLGAPAAVLAVAALTLGSYPVLMAVDRANVELLLFALVACFAALRARGDRRAWLPSGSLSR